ncbi:MAG TPA: MFS transporter [Rhizomicrobium sp.]|nr:MFS transporter [Rhizomicrobium sp.]
MSSFLTTVPARLDRLPWSRFHTLVVVALGVTWILDGLEVTLVGSLAGVLGGRGTLGLTGAEIGYAGSAYIAGAVLGALLFGDLTDRFGRKKLFLVTLGVYLAATIATGLSWDFASFALLRFLTGAGIGGEYAAINSAIQEFVPARLRGRVDLFVNGSFWVGAAIGALGSIVVLDPALVPAAYGWRLAFILGGALAGIVIRLRVFVPESPRWLMTHGRAAEAEAVVAEIERHVGGQFGMVLTDDELPPIRLQYRGAGTGLAALAATLFRRYPSRTFLGLVLMATQAFCYNAIFFTYALILTKFQGVDPTKVGWYVLPFAAGNFLGPLLLGPLFDIWGRKPMIAGTYILSAALMVLSGFLFETESVGAFGQTVLWSVNFFFASCGASAAYLTVGESFPLEVRARAIGFFYAFGTAIGGISGPALFGVLIESGERLHILWGYLIGAALMFVGGLTELRFGPDAARVPLEAIAPPLSRVE